MSLKISYSYPTVQIISQKNWYTYSSISLFHPYIDVKSEDSDCKEKTKPIEMGIMLPTTITVLSQENTYFGIKLMFLGFGIGFLKQWNY